MADLDGAIAWLRYCQDNPLGQVDPNAPATLLAEIARLRALLPREPRVWFDGDEVPAGVWTYRVEMEWRDPEDAIEMLDPDEPCGNGNLGPLLEIVLPADIAGIVERARKEREATEREEAT